MALSVDARRALSELVPWRAAGAWMDNSHRGTLVAANLDLSFRVGEAGPELIDHYGGGENGLNLFLKQALAKIHFQPAILPTPAEIAYVDSVRERRARGDCRRPGVGVAKLVRAERADDPHAALDGASRAFRRSLRGRTS